MKKIIFSLLLSSFLFSGLPLLSQTPWYIGGNAISGAAAFGSTTVQPVVFISSGAERGRLHASGNWAFGTSAGADRVQINSTGTVNPLRVMFAGATKLLVHNGGGVAIGASVVPPANGLFVATRIGIATATPAFQLDARGTSAYGQFKASSGYAGLILDKSAANQNEYVLHRTAGADMWAEGTIGNDNFSLRNSILGADALTVNITNNYVGIGTNSPIARLHVEPTGNDGGIYANGNDGIAVQGRSFRGTGVYGYSEQGQGVAAWSEEGVGLTAYGNEDGIEASADIYDGVYAFSRYGNGVRAVSAWSNGLYAITSESSAYAGYFEGNTYCTGSYLPSDAKLKQNIASVDNAMDMINRLQPKNYEYRNDGNFAKMNLPTGQHYGFISQDLEKVLPNLVKQTSFDGARTVPPAKAPSIAPLVNTTTPAGPQPVPPPKEIKGEKIDFKAVNYIEIIPIVVKGMQEQDIKMKAQDVEIASLKSEINELRALILKNINSSTATAAAGYLKQNTPNPPNGNTVVKYFAPNDARNTEILITDLNGSILKTYKVSNGEGQLTIRTGELPSGTYNYTLFVNNNKIDTKQMIIAR